LPETSTKDFLTGLFNRQYLYSLYDTLTPNMPFHIMFIDLDNFKSVNDVYGHNEGDLVLKAVANILRASAPEADAIRLSGDEFLLFFKGTFDRDTITDIAGDIISRISEKQGFSHVNINISASIGILYNQTSGIALNELMLKSDRALYYAKKHGKSCYIVYNDIEAAIEADLKMELLQHSALANGAFELCYLPVMNAQTGKLHSTQIRVRWNMPDGTVHEQKDFLPLFEKNGFVRQLNLWMLPLIFENFKRFRDADTPLDTISFRVSKLLLLERNFASELKELADKYDVPASAVTIEISETSFTRGSQELVRAMEAVKAAGFRIAIIHVGSDFKSLAYWDKLDLDSITFDPEYVQKTLATPRGQQILITLLSMGRQLKMRVVVDGIRTLDDELFLCDYSCNAVSGPYYSAPLSEADYFEYIKDRLPSKEENIIFPFLKDFCSSDGCFSGTIVGEGITLTTGISDNWGALQFPGGYFLENILEFPGTLLGEAWTICIWVNSAEAISWSSIIYAKYKGHYVTFSPFVEGGTSIFRISDGTVHGYHDTLARALQPDGGWHFICMTYDEYTGVARSYLDGIKTGVLTDIPSMSACQKVVLGGDAFQPSYQGHLSGLIIYNQVKSDDEILALFEQFQNEPGFNGTF